MSTIQQAAGLSNPENIVVRTMPQDDIKVDAKGIELWLDPRFLPKEITEGGLLPELTEHLSPSFKDFYRKLKRKAGEVKKRIGRGEEITEAKAQAEIEEMCQEFHRNFERAVWSFLEERSLGGKSVKLAIPTDPVTRQVIRAIYNRQDWGPDNEGKPLYNYKETIDRHFTLTLYHPPAPRDVAIALWEYVKRLSTETVDVFLILLNRLACLRDPGESAFIKLEDMAKCRRIKHRGGKAKNLYDDLIEDIKIIASLRLTMIWKIGQETLAFGNDLPDALLYITDWEYEGKGRNIKAFSIRAGEPLLFFLNRDKGRLVGYCSTRLLELDPYHDALAKKIGVYAVLTAPCAAAYGKFTQVKIRTILDFCGETPNSNEPGKTVKRIIKAFEKLVAIGLIPALPPNLSPIRKGKGYLERWLEEVITIELPPCLCSLKSRNLPPSAGETHLSGG